MYICGYKRMLMPQDWINVHTHRPGEGVNIVDPCLGNVIMPGQGAVYFSLGLSGKRGWTGMRLLRWKCS